MSKLRRWMPRILLVLGVWLVISLATRVLLSGRNSVEKTLQFLETKPAAAASAEVRRAWIRSIASRLASLDMDSRHLVMMDPRLRAAFLEMSAEDQSAFLEATEPPRMKELIEGSKRWSDGRCLRVMQPALADLEELKPGSTARFRAMLPSNLTMALPAIEVLGIEGAFKDPTQPLTRFDSRPFVERIQKYSQLGR